MRSLKDKGEMKMTNENVSCEFLAQGKVSRLDGVDGQWMPATIISIDGDEVTVEKGYESLCQNGKVPAPQVKVNGRILFTNPHNDSETYDYMHILQEGEYEFTVKGYGTYERSSVLAGQVKICFVDSFDSLEEAQAEYPEAQLSSGMMEPQNTFDHLPDGPDDGSLGWGSSPDDY
jgi:hypothetical protein